MHQCSRIRQERGTGNRHALIALIAIAALILASPLARGAAAAADDEAPPSGVRLTTKDHEHHLRVIEQRTADITISDWVWDNYELGLERIDQALNGLHQWGRSLFPGDSVHGIRPIDEPPSLRELIFELGWINRAQSHIAMQRIEQAYFDGLALHHVPDDLLAELRHAFYRRHLLAENRLFAGANVDVLALLLSGEEDLPKQTRTELADIKQAYAADMSQLLLEQVSIRHDPRLHKKYKFPEVGPPAFSDEECVVREARQYTIEGEITSLNDACVSELRRILPESLGAQLTLAWKQALYPFLWDGNVERAMEALSKGDEADGDDRIIEIRAYQEKMHSRLWEAQNRAASSDAVIAAYPNELRTTLKAEFNALEAECAQQIAVYREDLADHMPSMPRAAPPTGGNRPPRATPNAAAPQQRERFAFERPTLSRDDLEAWIEQHLSADAATADAIRALHDEFVATWYAAVNPVRDEVLAHQERIRQWEADGRQGEYPTMPDDRAFGIPRWAIDRIPVEASLFSGVEQVLDGHAALDSWKQFEFAVRRGSTLPHIRSYMRPLPLPDLIEMLDSVGIVPAANEELRDASNGYVEAVDEELVHVEERYFKLQLELTELRFLGDDSGRGDEIWDEKVKLPAPLYRVTMQFYNVIHDALEEPDRSRFELAWNTTWFPELVTPTPVDLAAERLTDWLRGREDDRVEAVAEVHATFDAARREIDRAIMQQRSPVKRIRQMTRDWQEDYNRDFARWSERTKHLPYAVYETDLSRLQMRRYKLVVSACNSLKRLFKDESLPSDVWLLLEGVEL